MARITVALALGGLAVAAAACDRDTGAAVLGPEAAAAANDVGVAAVSLRPRPPAPPTVLATAPDQEALDGLLVADGQVLFGGWRTVERPPDAGGPPFEMIGVLRRVPVSGGDVVEVWSGNGGVNDIASAPGALLFLAYDFYSRTGHLNRIPSAGGAAVELANWFSHGSSHSLASDSDVAYWTHSAGAGTFVKRTTADGTTVTLTDSSTIGSSADNIQFKEGSVYFVSSQAQRTVYGMPADGTAAPVALYAAPRIDCLAASPASPALFACANTAVVAIDLGNGNTRTVFSGTSTIVAIAADDAAVYFGSTDPGTGAGAVTRLARRGGRAVVIASGAFTPRPIAVDATSVYWVDSGTRTVWQVAK
jgi:hypothetical protein